MKTFKEFSESAHQRDFDHHVDKAQHYARDGDSDTADEHIKQALHHAEQHFKKTGKKVRDHQAFFGTKHKHIDAS